MKVFVFFLLLFAGLLMIGAEIFLPGGILGVLGAAALFGAVIAGFAVFGPAAGLWIALGILALAALSVALWMRFFPKTRLGKALTLTRNEKNFYAASHEKQELPGKHGKALSDLRPAGIALIEGRRMDVVSEGGMIRGGQEVKVVAVSGNKVIVRPAAGADERHDSGATQ